MIGGIGIPAQTANTNGNTTAGQRRIELMLVMFVRDVERLLEKEMVLRKRRSFDEIGCFQVGSNNFAKLLIC